MTTMSIGVLLGSLIISACNMLDDNVDNFEADITSESELVPVSDIMQSSDIMSMSMSDGTVGSEAGAVVSGRRRFRNLLSGRCMGVSGASTASGALIQQFSCDGRVNQKWQAFGENSIQNVNSLRCMGTANGGSGANIAQFPCDGRPGEQFFLLFPGDGTLKWVSFQSGLCIGVDGASRANGAQLKQFPCDNHPNQRWFVEVQ